MDLAAIETALPGWVSTLTGLELPCVQWENAPRRQTNGRGAYLSWVGSQGVGVDGLEWDFAADPDPLAEMTPASRGPRLLTLQIAVESFDQRPGYTGRAALERLRDCLHFPSSRALLAAAGLALGAMPQGVLQADYPADNRWVSRALLEVRLNAASSTTDPAGRTGTIATVGVTTGITDVSGAALPAPLQLGGTLP